ncbi:MAG TPA: Dps family protein [Acidimicrobiia bacterium]|nr:Dps family protein [Acidimicrobiia bacterium]
MTVDMDTEAREEITGALSRLLADTYTLYLKTQGHHWNVTGPMFPALHAMFEAQYIELRDAVDLIAERIRTLGDRAPAGFKAYGALTSVDETDGSLEALEMVRDLADGHETAVRTARVVVAAAEKADDIATVDLATTRVEMHEKTAWMLRATAQ